MRPRWALAVASDRRSAGRSGTDLIALIAIVLLATQLRGLVGAIWLGGAIDGSLGLGPVSQLLSSTLAMDLGFLVPGALVLWLPPLMEVELLCACVNKEVLAPGVIIGNELAFWAQALRFAGSLAARQRFLPGLQEIQGLTGPAGNQLYPVTTAAWPQGWPRSCPGCAGP